jgi:urease accessory protein
MVMLATKPEKPPVERGHAHLSVELVSGQSTVTSAWSSEPIKILVPKSRGVSAWACTSSFGGGMVGGDETRLDLNLGSETRCFVGTQASTKIYRNPSRLPCSHVTRANLEANSLLVFAPDPVQAFAGSTYSQRQEFFLAPGAGLVLLDWFGSGRAARGERWQFSQFKSRNEVFIAGERIFLDSILLDSSDGLLDSSMRAGRFNCFAMLLFIGEPLRAVANQLLEKISAKSVERKSPLVASASPIRDGAVLRIAGEQVEAVGREIHRHLDFLSEFLGDDPWARKW